MLLQDQCKYAQALDYLLKVITIREKVFGADDPVTIKSRLTMIVLVKKQGLRAQALAHFRKALTDANATSNEADAATYRRYIDLLTRANPKT